MHCLWSSLSLSRAAADSSKSFSTASTFSHCSRYRPSTVLPQPPTVLNCLPFLCLPNNLPNNYFVQVTTLQYVILSKVILRVTQRLKLFRFWWKLLKTKWFLLSFGIFHAFDLYSTILAIKLSSFRKNVANFRVYKGKSWKLWAGCVVSG